MTDTTMKSGRKIDDVLLAEKHSEGLTQSALAELFGCSQVAISRRLKRMAPPPSILTELTPKRAAFVKNVVSGMTPTNAALASHDCSTKDSGKSLSRKLMKDEEIRMSIDQLLEHIELDRSFRLRKLKQHCDHPDAGLSLKALELAMKVGRDFTPTEVDTTSEVIHRHFVTYAMDRIKEMEAEQIVVIA